MTHNAVSDVVKQETYIISHITQPLDGNINDETEKYNVHA